jgi:pyruvate dehydrogenase E1 component beta subunit
MAINGLKPVCEIQFSGFNYLAMHQIESHVARMRVRTQGRFPLPMVIRMPYGAGVRALEHHSESKEAWFAHTPGLKVVIPSSPRLARELLVSAIRDPDPVVFFEPKALYREGREDVPDELEQPYPIGRARVVREGTNLSLITFGAMLPRCLAAAEQLADDDVDAEVVDLLTISPLDDDTIVESVSKTGRAVIVHEAHRSFGIGAEIIARINERCLFRLEAPIERVAGFDVHVPLFAREQDYLPDERSIVRAARRVVERPAREKAYVQSVQVAGSR